MLGMAGMFGMAEMLPPRGARVRLGGHGAHSWDADAQHGGRAGHGWGLRVALLTQLEMSHRGACAQVATARSSGGPQPTTVSEGLTEIPKNTDAVFARPKGGGLQCEGERKRMRKPLVESLNRPTQSLRQRTS